MARVERCDTSLIQPGTASWEDTPRGLAVYVYGDGQRVVLEGRDQLVLRNLLDALRDSPPPQRARPLLPVERGPRDDDPGE